nr:probable sugar phosphate/phosphate translocator At3g14410 [Ipomoea batatas]
MQSGGEVDKENDKGVKTEDDKGKKEIKWESGRRQKTQKEKKKKYLTHNQQKTENIIYKRRRTFFVFCFGPFGAVRFHPSSLTFESKVGGVNCAHAIRLLISAVQSSNAAAPFLIAFSLPHSIRHTRSSPSMADPPKKIVKEEALTYAYILLYIALSSGQIFFNKWVLSSKEINFPYPLALTLLHMVFSSVACFLLTKVFKIMKVEPGMTLEIYIWSVIPIGAMFAMTLWLGNTAYLYISVSFAQMLKAIMPVAVFILGVAAGLEVMSCRMLLIMSIISFGVLVASYGEININWIGVVYQMGGVVGEALRLIFMEILVKRKGLKLNPISVIAICLLVPWIFLEKPKMEAQETWSFQPLILSLNSLCTFALNLSVFLVISHTSALTIRVAGVVKDWVVVLLSALIFADTKLTLINIFAIAGVAAYNNHKLKKEASRTSTNDESEPTQSIPLVSSNSEK